ncbi:MAG: hypothetical protein JO190_01945 [Candidatus Eremiobacteraeota bacterium]|nr:hypothetical protein [Candidatus Eremiobacteraeota bacterium]
MPYFAVIRDRGAAWDWSRPMRRQEAWQAHARFMDELAEAGFILAGGPLGGEDDAPRVLHVISASDRAAVEAKLDQDPWTAMGLLQTASIEPWTVLLGELRRPP